MIRAIMIRTIIRAMTRPLLRLKRLLDRVLLRVASCLVPASGRAEWRREWLAELWQVERIPRQSAAETQSTHFASTAFCLGAFRDALDLRRNAPSPWQHSSIDRSAWTCLLALATLLLLSFSVSLFLPGASVARHAERFQVHSGLVLIRDAAADSDWSASVPIRIYRQLKGSTQRGFDSFAYYRMAREQLGSQPAKNVAHASSNLFSLLGLNLAQGDGSGVSLLSGATPQVVLSNAVWKTQFHGDPQMVGREIHIGARSVRVAAVAPAGIWRLPGAPDAWLLEPDAAIEPGGLGYVLAHLTPRGADEMWNGRAPIAFTDGNDNARDYWAVSFSERTGGPWGIYLFAIFLALVSLPALVSVSMEDVQFSIHSPSWERVLLRRGFLGVKALLILAIAYFVSLDLAFGASTSYIPGATGVQFLSCLLTGLLGLRWAVLDQQHRCPICLRKVAHPARVGMASRTFLAWNGTELMCAGGHTLLHVPGLPTSWFNTPRWVYLDPSWQFLFSE